MPRRCASAGGVRMRSSPSSRISPAFGSSAPDRTWTSVDLPAPLSPTRPTTSPRCISSDSSLTAWIAPKVLVMPRRLSSAMGRSAPGEAAADAAERDGNDQQPAGKQVLGEDRRTNHGEAVIADRDRDDAEQGAEDMELAFAQRRGAEEGGGERGQHEAVAGGHLAGAEVRGHQDAGDGRAGAGDGEADDAAAIDGNAGAPRILGADADRLDVLALHGAVEQDPQQRDDHGHDQHQMRHAPEAADADVGEGLAAG